MIPADRRYTDQHEWIRPAGLTATVGITDFAQDALGDLTFLDLPAPGKTLTKGDEAVAVESCKAAASVYAPAGGKVTEVNQALASDPGLVNREPFDGGWLFKMTLDNPSDLDDLMDAAAYEKFLESQK